MGSGMMWYWLSMQRCGNDEVRRWVEYVCLACVYDGVDRLRGPRGDVVGGERAWLSGGAMVVVM